MFDDIKWEDVPSCPLCKNLDTKEFYINIPATRPITHWRICEECGHIYCAPQPEAEWLAAWYKNGYRMMSYQCEDAEQVPENSVKEEITRAIRLCHMLLRTVPKATHTLDVGSSTGVLMAGVFDKFEPRFSYGVEPNDAWRTFSGMQFGKAPDMPEKTKLVTTLKKIPKSPKFDLVTCVHTLEHIADPLETLIHLRKAYMRQDGYLLVEVPNLFGGIVEPTLFPHLHAFHHDTLLRIVEAAGFTPVCFETSDLMPPTYISPQNLTVVASVKFRSHTKGEMLERYGLYRQHTQDVLANAKNARAGYTAG